MACVCGTELADLGRNGAYFIGLTVLDTYGNDRLQLTLQSSNGTILSGGTGLTGTKRTVRIGWLTSANVLEDETDYEFRLTLDLAAGTWTGQINDQPGVSGTFNTDHIVGIEAYQATFSSSLLRIILILVRYPVFSTVPYQKF